MFEKIHADIKLVVPGAGAERAVLKEESGTVISIKGYPESVSEFAGINELFRHVFDISSPVKISFNKIYYYEKLKSVIFFNDNIVTGIVGLTNARITYDSIDLKKGVEYFIFGYGNNRLTTLIKSDGKKRDKIYIYPELGIAVFDDNDDDVIDMYIIFPGTIKQ
jgi:hypothetical protein